MTKKQVFPGTDNPLFASDGADVNLTVEVKYLDDNSPATGTRIFDHYPNMLLGTIDDQGKAELTIANGTVIRLVEPAYGLQQSIQQVIGIRDPSGISVARVGEGWTI